MATRAEREAAFIAQRTAELEAAGRQVSEQQLRARFNTLAETAEGRRTITDVVQRGRQAQTPTVTSPTTGQAPLEAPRPLPTSRVTGSVMPSTPTVLPVSMSAKDELRAILGRYQLEGLFDALDQAIMADETLVRNADALFGAVRNNPVYQARFKGNQERINKGLPVLSEAEYVQQENQYRTVLRNLGMPRGFYDDQDSFARFIANDVSPSELSARIQQGYNVIANSPPQVLAELRRMVPDLNEGELAAYVLDPQKSGMEIERRARAAQIAAAATTTAGMTLSLQQAEDLARQGITPEQAQQGFAQIASQQELFQAQRLGETEITQQEILQGTFTNEQAAAERIRRRRRERTAAFETGGGFAGQGGQQTGLSTVGM